MSKSTIHIAIDGNEANQLNRVGSNVYAFELLTALEKITRSKKDVIFSILLAKEPVADWPKPRTGWQYTVLRPSKLWTQWALPLHLYVHQKTYNLLFTPGHYVPLLCPIDYVSSVMDLGFLAFPTQFKKRDYLQLKWLTKKAVSKAKKIITISQFSKQEIINKYGVADSNISVIYPSVTTPKLPSNLSPELSKQIDLSNPYILYVGTLQPRKNLETLVAAFERVHRQIVLSNSSSKNNPKRRSQTAKLKKLTGLQLVLAGKKGWLTKTLEERIENSPYKEKIFLTGFVTEQDKNYLIKNAQVLTLIGLYEGFGIPALEALHLGTLPVVANNSSLKEVVGPAGVLVNPNSVKSVAEGLEEILTLNAKQKAEYRKKGREQRVLFSWDTSAQQLLSLLTSLK